MLCAKGIRAEAYHGAVSAGTRTEVQRRWQQYETPVVVATIAFGMGIDNPAVRRVCVHIPRRRSWWFDLLCHAARKQPRDLSSSLNACSTSHMQ